MLTLGDKGRERPVGGIVCEKYCYLNGQRLNLLWEKLATLFALNPAVPSSVMTAIAISFWFISQPWRLWKKISSVITFSKRRGHWNFNNLNNSNYFFFLTMPFVTVLFLKESHLTPWDLSWLHAFLPETITWPWGVVDLTNLPYPLSRLQLKIRISWSIRTHYSMSGKQPPRKVAVTVKGCQVCSININHDTWHFE